MSTSNWRSSAAAGTGTTDRRVNLAMTAELALASTTSGPAQNSYQGATGGVPRNRGGGAALANNATDSLGTFMSKPIGTSTNSFNSNNPMNSNNSNSGFGSLNTGERFFNNNNNNNNNLYSKPSMNNNNNNNNNGDSLTHFNSHRIGGGIGGVSAADPDSSQGFKVQRVRGGAGGTTNAASTATSTLTTGFGMTAGGTTNSFGNSNNTKFGSRIDENADIDTQTRLVKREIDSLDVKLNMKSNLNDHQQQQTFGGNGNSGSSTGFSNINNTINNTNNSRPMMQFNTGNSSNTNGMGLNLRSEDSHNNLGGRSNGFASKPQLTTTSINQNNDFGGINNSINKRESIEEERSGPFKKMLSNPVLVGAKNPTSTVGGTTNAPAGQDGTNQKQEFSTGTYDPSNILGGTRQGRMRSLGRGGKDSSKNLHEEKAAQATGNKQLPDELAHVVVDQFMCPEGCGRTFNKKALEKHIPLCKKVFQPKKPTAEVPDTLAEKNKTASNKPNSEQQKLPPKPKKAPAGATKPAPDGVQAAKNEALKKLKEQKKKELANAGQNGLDEDNPQKSKPTSKKGLNDEDDDMVQDDQDDKDYF